MRKSFRIGLFGGSFDPPTKAHIHVAEQLVEKGIVDRVEFVPAYKSYHKKNYIATPQQRIDMLKLAISNSKYANKLSVNTYEIDNEMNTCTFYFVEKYLQYSEDVLDRYEVRASEHYYFVVGMDNGKMIPRFKHGDKLMETIPFIVVNRGEDIPVGDEWFNEEPHQVVDIGNAYEGCSSSKIREILSKYGDGRLLPSTFYTELCDFNVFMFIMNNNLYMD